jgi:hypothetical protein
MNAFKEHNRTRNPDHVLHGELMPEPFVGDPAAPVVLLQLNPRASTNDVELHATKEFQTLIRDSLAHRFGQYPFYLLDPKLDLPGGDYWKEKLRSLIRDCGDVVVARRLAVVEFHGYQSKNFRSLARWPFPSSQYAIELVKRAIARSAVIVCMRGFERWSECVPELSRYDRVVQLKNRRNPCISAGNMTDREYSMIRQAING